MDNCGGASWFVLLAAEKNEQINDLSTPLLWNYRSFGVSPILPMQHKEEGWIVPAHHIKMLDYKRKRVSLLPISWKIRKSTLRIRIYIPLLGRYFKPPPLCFAQQNIGEVSEGRRGWKNSDSNKIKSHTLPAVSRSNIEGENVLYCYHRKHIEL